jgi:hypothetical protein
MGLVSVEVAEMVVASGNGHNALTLIPGFAAESDIDARCAI